MDDNYIKAPPHKQREIAGCTLNERIDFGKPPIEGLARTLKANKIDGAIVEWDNIETEKRIDGVTLNQSCTETRIKEPLKDLARTLRTDSHAGVVEWIKK